jgi:hypothetical protein
VLLAAGCGGDDDGPKTYAAIAVLESQSQEPPDLGDGAPHVALGTFAEARVE